MVALAVASVSASMTSGAPAMGRSVFTNHSSRRVNKCMTIGPIMLIECHTGAFLMPEGTNSTARSTFSGAAHMSFARMPAPNEPPMQRMRANPKASITCAAHSPYA